MKELMHCPKHNFYFSLKPVFWLFERPNSWYEHDEDIWEL